MSKQRHLQISCNNEVHDNQQENPQDVLINQDIPIEQDIIEFIPQMSKRQRKEISFANDLHAYLVEGSKNDIHSSVPYYLAWKEPR